MRVPMKWLREFVDYKGSAEEFAEKLTMSGSSVEAVEYVGRDIKNVVIGEVLEVKKHPQAEKLLVTRVNTGNRVLTIITGAQNIKEGDKVVVALPGATIEGGKEIKVQNLRGIESEGMLCSARELGLDDHGLPEDMKNGLLVLPKDAPVGKDIKEYIDLEDAVVEFELTPNRGDCFSIIGIAREASATFDIPLKAPFSITAERRQINEIPGKVRVTVEAPDLCRRYIARIIEDVKIEPSPLWMQRRLQLCGIRPINNIVDITNYVMLELGQPLHAFDYDKLAGSSIIVRRGKKGEKLITLDGKEREITEDTLVIADEKGPVALAGVMGGENSEVTESTRTVLLESANFLGSNIRRTAKRLGARTDASMRYEKGIDPNLAEIAAERACELVEKLGAGRVVKEYADVYPEPVLPKKLELRVEKINELLGTDISKECMVDILRRLGMGTEDEGGRTFVVVPTYRLDIAQLADIAEEIARIYGYDNLPSTLPGHITTLGLLNEGQKLEDEIKATLTDLGFSEIYTYSFISPSAFDRLKAPMGHEVRRAVKLMNPLGEDHSVMRTTLLEGILQVVKFNLNQKQERIRIFEVGKVFLPKALPLTELPNERKVLGLALCDEKQDFYHLKEAVEVLFSKLKIKNYRFEPDLHFALHPGRTARISVDGQVLGHMGEIHPDVMENYDIQDERIYVAELDLELLIDRAAKEIKYQPLPKFPAAERDVALVVKEDVAAGSIMEAMEELGGELLEKVELFDIYRGEQIPKGCKSLAFSLTYRAKDRTLTDEEINEMHAKIVQEVINRFEGRLRE
ncbi:MAG: phenylalanine--tRNA ligase subunit beta [Bacillota bacterium]|nr:MAG: phenylalanine--tRNA ligase subunit beta [Bacillota bacterium]